MLPVFVHGRSYNEGEGLRSSSPQVYERTRHEDRRIRADQYADKQSKGEVEQDMAPDNQEGRENKEHCEGGDEGSAQHFVDAHIDHLADVGPAFILAMFSRILS